MIGHHSFYVVFQRTVKAAAAAAKPAQPPQAAAAEVAWNARLSGFYGHRWGLWEEYFQDKLPGLTWDAFQQEALSRNPHLAADQNVFYPDKTYLIPGDQDIILDPPMPAGQAAAPAPRPDAGQAPPPSSASSVEQFEPIAGEDYSTLIPLETRTDRPANIHADLNLALRGYTAVNEPAERISISFDKAPDAKAPQLFGLFHDHRAPAFSQCYRVHKWDWGRPPDDPGRRSEAMEDRWDVSVVGMQTTAGETLHVPDAGYDIGQGCRAIVLYADEERLTLHYTARDDVIRGYTIHIEHIWVEPGLLARYRQQGEINRSHLPGLRGGQAVGRAKGDEIKVAIRDTGQWMDPRSRLDWWQGK